MFLYIICAIIVFFSVIVFVMAIMAAVTTAIDDNEGFWGIIKNLFFVLFPNEHNVCLGCMAQFGLVIVIIIIFSIINK